MPRYGLATALVALLLSAVACSPTSTVSPTMTPSPSSSPSPTTTPGETPTPTPTVTTPTWTTEQQAAVVAVENWYVIYNEVLRDGRDPNQLATAARGQILTDTQLTYNQFLGAGLTVEGEVSVSDLTPSGLTKKSKRSAVVVNLCEDSTQWSIRDADGNDVLELDAKTVRPLAITVEEWPKDGWFVTRSEKGDQKC